MHCSISENQFMNKRNGLSCLNVPHRRKEFGWGVSGELIIDFLEFLFSSSPTGFSCFMEPNTYSVLGESIIEQFGFCRKTFNQGFDKVGTRYRSKTSYLRSKDKFKGKEFLYYYDRSERKCFFMRASTQTSMDTNYPQSEYRYSPKRESRHFRSEHFRSGGSFKERKNQRKKYIYIPSPTSPKTCCSEMGLSGHGGELIKIWNEEVKNSPSQKALTPQRDAWLTKALIQSFNSDLVIWREYCRRIARNDFLMGGGKRGWKATLYWSLHEENIQKVQGNFYTGQQSSDVQPLESQGNIAEVKSLQGEGEDKVFLRSLATLIGISHFMAWFRDVRIEGLESEFPRIIAPNRFYSDRIEANYRREILRAIQELHPHIQDIDIVAENAVGWI